jgi:glycosyltransferase involved in cell wall biosynthesis
MRVAYFTESLPPSTDGVARTLSHLADTLEHEGVDFRFFCPFAPDASFAWHDKVRKVPSVPFPLYRHYRVGMPPFSWIGRQLDEFRPDVVHIASPTPLGVYGLRYARRRRLPAVASYHTHFVRYFPYYGVGRLARTGWAILRWFHGQCAVNYAPSPSAAQELRRHGIDNVELWERGIDVARFSPAYRDVELRRSIGAEDVPVLLFVGRLVKEKNLDDLVEAAKVLRAWDAEFKLVIVGDGPMREELQERIPGAVFPGFQYGVDLARWYASADLFVFPSTTETFGNVIQEAFASGLPVVGVRQGGVGDLVVPGRNGFLAEPNSPLDFAQNVLALLKHDDVRQELGKRARYSVAQNTWDAVNLRLLASYEKLLGQCVAPARDRQRAATRPAAAFAR